MKTLSPALAAHYASPNTTVTTCWKVTRRDGARFGYTALDRDVVVQGVLYSATVGVAASAIASSNAFEIQNVEVTGLLQDGLMALGAMTEADILAGVWDDAYVTIFEVNYEDPTMGVVTLQSGTIGELKTGQVAFTAELRGLMQSLQQNIGHTVLPGCFKNVGDANCGVDLSLYTFTGAVGTLNNNRSWIDSSLGQVDHYFRYGLVKWLTGANAGLRMEVKDHASTGDVILQEDMPRDVAVGDTYTISAGCNKLLKTDQLVYAAALGGSVTSVNGEEFTDASRGEDDHSLDAARFTWVTGNNVGIVTEVSNFIGKTFRLLATNPFAVQTGDTYTVEPQVTTGNLVYTGDCKTKFVKQNPAGNGLNHGGFCEVPGNDKVLGAGNQ